MATTKTPAKGSSTTQGTKATRSRGGTTKRQAPRRGSAQAFVDQVASTSKRQPLPKAPAADVQPGWEVRNGSTWYAVESVEPRDQAVFIQLAAGPRIRPRKDTQLIARPTDQAQPPASSSEAATPDQAPDQAERPTVKFALLGLPRVGPAVIDRATDETHASADAQLSDDQAQRLADWQAGKVKQGLMGAALAVWVLGGDAGIAAQVDQGRTNAATKATAAKSRATAKRSSSTTRVGQPRDARDAALASYANTKLGKAPAAKITGPNLAALRLALGDRLPAEGDLDTRDLFGFGQALSGFETFARQGKAHPLKDKAGQAVRAFVKDATGIDGGTFYGQKLAKMLVTLAHDRMGKVPTDTPEA